MAVSRILLAFVVAISLCKSSMGQSEGLTSASVSEGPCNYSIRLASNVNTLWAVTPRDYYVPIGSEALYRGYAEVLLGRPAQSQEELDSMNLMVNLEAGTIFRSPGFTGSKSRYIKQNCLPQRVPANQFLCLPLDLLSSRGTNTSGITTSMDNVVYTDNEKLVLIVRCLNDKVQDYKLLSTTPNVTAQEVECAKKKIMSLNFDSSLMRVKGNIVPFVPDSSSDQDDSDPDCLEWLNN